MILSKVIVNSGYCVTSNMKLKSCICPPVHLQVKFKIVGRIMPLVPKRYSNKLCIC